MPYSNTVIYILNSKHIKQQTIFFFVKSNEAKIKIEYFIDDLS